MASRIKTQWPVARVRSSFIDFFHAKHQHRIIPSSPVLPVNDNSLLFTNAGMNQFKPIFLGDLEATNPWFDMKRAVNSQRCIRAGGKHNDLDDVGRDVYHHTFFEMLGNWSFGDYFKVEAIDMSWELLTEVYKLDQERLYASYFGGDESLGLPPDLEAKALWERYLPPGRVLPFGKKDNFWEMGAVGPCGPCSELHFDRIGDRDAAHLVNADDPDVIEIWNLVFIQFVRSETGGLASLPSKHIDTGMGLERLASVLQEKRSNYDTDAFTPLLEATHQWVGGEAYRGRVGTDDFEKRDTAYRVVADHARTLSVAIADGVLPSNEGRGYVLRRILRRAVRFGNQMLDARPGLMNALLPSVIETLGPAFPELEAKSQLIEDVLTDEEEAFNRTLGRGLRYFHEIRSDLSKTGATAIPGKVAFFLYDSHGFPVDLTQQMGEEAGLTVDVKGFETEMEQQKATARLAQQKAQADQTGFEPLCLDGSLTAVLEAKGVSPTIDIAKYDWNIRPCARVCAILGKNGFVESAKHLGKSDDSNDMDDVVGIILDATPFYAEAGGQTSDVGHLLLGSGDCHFQVKDVQSYAGYVLHSGHFPKSAIHVGDEVTCQVDYEYRSLVAPNHTMTHALNWALRKVVGEGCNQRGSLVTSNSLRFDFDAPKALTLDQLREVERLLQEAISAAHPVMVEERSLASAQQIEGLRSMFGEAYPDPVRVVSINSPNARNDEMYSVELCGGTHIKDLGQAKDFVIVEERAVAKGVRRLVALTGEQAAASRRCGSELKAELRRLLEASEPDDGAIAEVSKAAISSDLPLLCKAGMKPDLDNLRKSMKKRQKAKAKNSARGLPS